MSMLPQAQESHPIADTTRSILVEKQNNNLTKEQFNQQLAMASISVIDGYRFKLFPVKDRMINKYLNLSGDERQKFKKECLEDGVNLDELFKKYNKEYEQIDMLNASNLAWLRFMYRNIEDKSNSKVVSDLIQDHIKRGTREIEDFKD